MYLGMLNGVVCEPEKVWRACWLCDESDLDDLELMECDGSQFP